MCILCTSIIHCKSKTPNFAWILPEFYRNSAKNRKIERFDLFKFRSYTSFDIENPFIQLYNYEISSLSQFAIEHPFCLILKIPKFLRLRCSLFLSSLAATLWTTTTNQAGRMSFEGHVNLCCRAWFVLMETSSGRTPSMPWHLETPSSLWTPYSSWPKGWTTFAYPTQKSDFFALLSLLLQVCNRQCCPPCTH